MDNIKNVKISLILKSCAPFSVFIETAKKRMVIFKQQRNIFIIKDLFSITIFKKPNEKYHLNVTGIKSLKLVPDVIKWIFDIYCSEHTFELLWCKIDNITACFNLGYTISLSNLALQLTSSKYNPERFHAVYFKNDKGTAVIFSSGKINIVGAKSELDVMSLWRILQSTIRAVQEPQAS